MRDSDLIGLINSVQLTLKDAKYKSDQVLTVLCMYAEGKIERQLCVYIIFSLLRTTPELQQQFAEIVEEPPPPATNTGAFIHDIFINTIIEFELWPGTVDRFLHRMRDVFVGKISLFDTFIDLEYIKPTSGPFWLLWDIFEPISQTNHFIQLIYDGCVDSTLIPLHLKYDIKPSEFDNDPSLVTPDSIIASDLVCTYEKDIKPAYRPIGPSRIGSYGLLVRSLVNCKCSGRHVKDFEVLNDRWATGAAGLDVIFCAVRKNQYEERLFMNEDERIELDVRISRMRNTMQHLYTLYTALSDPNSQEAKDIVIDEKTFPKYNLTELDMYTISEIFGYDRLEEFSDRIRRKPLEILPIIRTEIEEKITSLTEFRRSKEAEYYDLNKRNSRRSLDVRHEPHVTPNVNIEDPMAKLRNGQTAKESFRREIIDTVGEILIKSAQQTVSKQQSDNVEYIVGYVKIVLGVLQAPELTRQLVFHAYPATTESDNFDKRQFCLTPDMYRFMNLYYLICDCVYHINSQAASSPLNDGASVRGLQVAVKLGHISASNLAPTRTEILQESIPQCVASGKSTPTLDSLFDMPQPFVLNSLDSLRKAIHMFIKIANQCCSDELSSKIVEAVRIPKNTVYNAYCCENLSQNLYVKCDVTQKDTKISLMYKAEVPRLFKVTRGMSIKCLRGFGPVALPHSLITEMQTNLLGTRRCKGQIRKSFGSRPAANSIMFRLGVEGVEIYDKGSDLIKPRENPQIGN
ncbi:hypothetical protein TVAG_252660 [Trichomonas vaginalis G3]|uniref:Histone deacetylase interacting domain-containing protein n=1 Tax=Trichomonas vaginalis (strain ATCC PRA-98 / G3) TaxID=412133 RepID=A2DW08_TRIV3|nr:histone deacetylation [Trichomonas vaginalis G3]EAY15453.1 hypothetical protein TVAG_252660 [Trichomonas vaginalis G3]KAI5499562.1 histone deacetylation [Trichomonas vaginalis G3]|eukprot:XP_001327676.1 hypothetical protein [Trichomonas vaginalis G3]